VFPDGLRARVDEFRAAWSSANVAALAGFYGEDEEQREKQLRKRFEHVGWNGKLPVLGDPHLHSSYRGNAGDYVAFAAPTGTVRTAWTRDGNQWNLTHLYLE
jgi:hypothetical protein